MAFTKHMKRCKTGIAENINTLEHPVHMDATQADKCINTEAHLPPFSLMITLTPPPSLCIMAPSLLRCELKGGSGELKDIGVPARGDSQFIERERDMLCSIS